MSGGGGTCHRADSATCHPLCNRRHLFGGQHKLAGNEDRFGHRALAAVLRGLEGLARRVGEAVEVQAVIPVGAADQRQAVRPEPLQRVAQAALQVIVERLLGARPVLVDHRLVQDRRIARFLEVRGHAQDQPQRVVVEAAADRIVAALGQRLVLVERAAALELGRSQVQDSLPGSRRDHVDEAQQILGGVTETHAAANTRLEEGCRTGHVKGHHALVGIPEVDHAIGVFVGRLHLVGRQQLAPAGAQRLEGRVHGQGDAGRSK